MGLSAEEIKRLAKDCGFDLVGLTPAVPLADGLEYQEWAARGMAGKMTYLADHRASIRLDPRHLLPSARTVVCLGKVYHAPAPLSVEVADERLGWIARYAWGMDYHDVLKVFIYEFVRKLLEVEKFEYRVCVDTAPLLERSYARMAGLGWIGRNTCLINQEVGSWVFLAEILVSLELEADAPPPDRCGTCRRCIDACPTEALVFNGRQWELDARLCIAYYTIELKGSIPEEARSGIGRNVFGCDICQDVCPWNRRAAVTSEAAFQPGAFAPDLEAMAGLTEAEFREMFRATPVSRARYTGFLRNVAVAMGNSGRAEFRPALERLAASEDAVVAEHAVWALARLADSHASA